MHGEYPSGPWPRSEEPRNNVVPINKETKPKPGSYAVSMELLGFKTITDAQMTLREMIQGGEEYSRLAKLIRLAKTAAYQEHVEFDDLDIDDWKEKGKDKWKKAA